VRLLVIGGTEFVGRHLVQRAVAAGHEVTVFHRGVTEPAELPSVGHLHGDRDGGLGVLEGHTWDAVVDVCGYVPRLVRDSARMLADAALLCCFISTESVYADPLPSSITESSPLASLDDPTSEDVDVHYGALKVLCEREVAAAFGRERSLIVRPGYVVGPHDPTDRFTYWVRRMTLGGEALAAGSPEAMLQCIDARDLASFVIELVERVTADVFNADGPPVEWGTFLETCRNSGGAGTTVTWVPEARLLEDELTAEDLPLWEPAQEAVVDLAKPLGAGLTHRGLEQTVRDTLAWDRARGFPEPMAAGLKQERERELLSAYRS
jgi:2'-hydroxyisoflavone reductase